METSSVNVKVGEDQPAKTKLEAKVFINNVEAGHHIHHIAKGITLDENNATAIIRIQTKAGAEIIEKLKGLVEDIKTAVTSEGLGEEPLAFINSVQF